ncbi:hypothetical protein GUITHDRAFT_113243 [Guillardia theta CCMP2712]|uniref:RWP-RK domain-containing protein n=1 Tax=Guillardia theta (strain CCMP2712) TaxID=905079 RepID=L1IX80_GUITC|nr:hypothetical protein GUITHDRAFT_113243 [Guillardia theta CCMP2712]EKX40712.1 hypothetical protein GUITHDRAFT_113243 [Guillardia theta CCMP2712]|eukprot:XP_005827692.1 hypothetical protein GUITHDRAFT_113243 [Guillardia theta CCMP2712]
MYTRIKVFPRKKAGQEEKNKPFYLSTLDLTTMFHLSLQAAADELGISLTAMKNTCKKLGVRWPTQHERQRLQEEREAGGLEAVVLARRRPEAGEKEGLLVDEHMSGVGLELGDGGKQEPRKCSGGELELDMQTEDVKSK